MPYLLLALLAVGLGVFLIRRRGKQRAITALLAKRLTEHQRAVLIREVPLVRRLPVPLLDRLEGKIHRFLDQVEFQGCNGLEVDEEMEISIAAQACLLIVNSDIWYDGLSTVLVYPGAFKSTLARYDGYVVTEEEVVRTGESWLHGPVILSWEHSQQGAYNERDGHNVVFHEFAHQIDAMSGATNGVPLLGQGQSFADWEAAFLTAYEAHVSRVSSGRRTVIDAYGAQNHEEFFAVAVELFFERPKALQREDPAIYAELRKLFRLDPADWS